LRPASPGFVRPPLDRGSWSAGAKVGWARRGSRCARARVVQQPCDSRGGGRAPPFRIFATAATQTAPGLAGFRGASSRSPGPFTASRRQSRRSN